MSKSVPENSVSDTNFQKSVSDTDFEGRSATIPAPPRVG
jgi:hypothetical protein